MISYNRRSSSATSNEGRSKEKHILANGTHLELFLGFTPRRGGGESGTWARCFENPSPYQNLYAAYGKTCAHTPTPTQGARAVRGPSRASPMQRCLLAVGSCHWPWRLTALPGNDWYQSAARKAAARVDLGRDEGMMGTCLHQSGSCHLMMCIYVPLALKG